MVSNKMNELLLKHIYKIFEDVKNWSNTFMITYFKNIKANNFVHCTWSRTPSSPFDLHSFDRESKKNSSKT